MAGGSLLALLVSAALPPMRHSCEAEAKACRSSRTAAAPSRKLANCPKRFYRRRHKIENFFCRIKDWRRIATRYDKVARNFLAATTLVGVLYWIKL